MPYYRRKYRVNLRTRSTRRLASRRVSGKVRLHRYTKPSSRKSLGMRLQGAAADYSLLYRVVGPTNEFAQMCTAGQTESSQAESTNSSYDALSVMWASANFNSQVRDRYGSIKVRGVAFTRIILGIDNTTGAGAIPFNPEVAYVMCVYRVDHDIPYGVATGATPTVMLQFQDVETRVIPINQAIVPTKIECKVFARSEQLFALDTSIAPGAPGNNQYWDTSFAWGFQFGQAAAQNVNVQYRDVVEILYDGYKKK